MCSSVQGRLTTVQASGGLTSGGLESNFVAETVFPRGSRAKTFRAALPKFPDLTSLSLFTLLHISRRTTALVLSNTPDYMYETTARAYTALFAADGRSSRDQSMDKPPSNRLNLTCHI